MNSREHEEESHLEALFSHWRQGDEDACVAAFSYLWSRLYSAMFGYVRYAGGDQTRVMNDAFSSALMTFDQLISGGKCENVVQQEYQRMAGAAGTALNDYHDGLSWLTPMISWPGASAFEAAFLTCFGDKCRIHREWDIMAE